MPRPTLWNLGFGGFCAGGFLTALSVPRSMPWGFAIVLACGAVGGLVGSAAWWRWVRPDELRRHQRVFGICAHCGYSLRGNVSGMCPECGTARAGR
jgi:hypothetical protein